MTELELAIINYFGPVPTEQLEEISSMFKKRSIAKGEFILKSGKQCRSLDLVSSGLLRIFVYTENKEVSQWISSQGYFATDLSSFIFQSPARWNIQALVDTEVYSISRSNYQNLSKLVPLWNELEKMFLIKCFASLEDRIFSHLSMTAEERYHFFFENHKELFNQVPQQYIASILGMTPETFSRIRKKQLE